MDLLAMGKYSAHVWSSFGITAAVIVICAVQARRRHATVLRKLQTRIRAMETDE